MDYKEINLDDWELRGEGATAFAYSNKGDGNQLVKLFKDGIPLKVLEHEYHNGIEVAKLGLSTPEIYGLVKTSDKYGIVYERIRGKKSFSRAIADDYENIEKYMKLFAEEVYKLHHTECGKDRFPAIKDTLRRCVPNLSLFPKEDLEKIVGQIDKLGDNTTCVHGDMHIGNIIIADWKPYWIDLGTFSYGDPMFDLGGYFFMMNIASHGQFIQDTFHLKTEQMLRCWELFVKYYYKNDSKEFLQEINAKIAPFASLFYAMTVTHLGVIPPDVMEVGKIVIGLIK